jgi:mRNA interferase RelE/StbE
MLPMAGNESDDTFELEWTEYSRKDYKALDGSQLVFVDKGLDRIRKLGMAAGLPLAGDLAGCRKLKHQKLGLRIIFQQSKRGITVIQIVAIGARSDSAVYRQAKHRRSG